MKTKKLGRVARFKARYGKRIKDMVKKVEDEEFRLHTCPSCGFESVKRKASGIFECRKCGIAFAGGAYTPETMVGSTIRKIVSQKAFATGLAELEKIKASKETEKEETKKKDVLSKMKESLEKVKEETEKKKEEK